MRLIKYNVILDEHKRNILVKEKAFNYNDQITQPDHVIIMLEKCFHISALAEEYMFLVTLDNKGKPLGIFEVTHGTVNMSYASPREIFIRVLLTGATSYIICHNHPSGDIRPSEDDIKFTKRIRECSDLMNVPMLDHIIIGDNNFLSLKQYLGF